MTKFNKIFNFRLFVFGFIAFVIGIFVALSFFVSLWFLLAFGIVTSLAVVLFFALRLHRKCFLHLPRIVAILFCLVLGIAAFSAREGVYRSRLPKTDFYFVSARVASVSEGKVEGYNVKLDSVILKTTSGKSKKVSGKVIFWTERELEVGDKVSLSAKFVANDHKSIKDLAYETSGRLVYCKNLSVKQKGLLSVSDKVKKTAWSRLESNVAPSQAGTLFAMLFGDKSKIDDTTKENYQATGVAHILAVSGLHVGFFVLLLSMLFDLLKINKKIKFALISVALALYCWLCGFSYSILRASIMSIVCLYAGLRGKQYDGISSLCFASIIILSFDANQLFRTGFLLSFFSVFAIFCLQKVFRDFFAQHFPKLLTNSLSLSIAVSIGVYPWLSYAFGYIAPYSILFNIIIIPIITIVYMLTFVLMLFAMPFSFCGVLLHAPEYLLKGVDIVCKFAAGLPGAVLKTQVHPVTIVMWIAAVILSCDYLLTSKKTKLTLSLSMWLGTLVLFVLNCCKVF